MKRTDKSKLKSNAVFFCTAALFALLIIKSSEVKAAVTQVFTGCARNIIPPLFPALALSGFMSLNGLPGTLRKTVGAAARTLLGISPDCTGAVVFGAAAGYPAGVKTAVQLFAGGRADKDSCARAAALFVNPGVVFTVITVGRQMCGSALTGVLLYTSVLLAQFLTGIITRKPIKNNTIKTETVSSEDYGQNLINAVNTAVSSCVSITAWITLFGAAQALVKLLPLRRFDGVLSLTSEVTQAVSYSLYTNSLPKCAFALGSGGLCVVCQLMPDIKKLGIPLRRFLFYRLFIGALSAVITKLALFLFPAAVTTGSVSAVFALSQTPSPRGFFSLLFLCVIFMFSIANRLESC